MDEKALRRLEEAVSKAIKNKETPPKRKHERNVILESWEERGASAVFMEIFRKPINQREFSCYKALIVIHKVLREGHPKALLDAYNRKSFFDAIRRQWNGYQSTYGKVIAGYTAYILSKIDFHHLHPEVDPSILLQKFMETAAKSFLQDPAKAFTLVTHLIDLQQSVIDFVNQIFAYTREGQTECFVSPLIPVVTESYNIYLLTVYLLKKLVTFSHNMDVFSFLTERFYAQYIELRKFYFNTSQIRYVTSIIAVPTLSQDPPKFEASNDMPRSRTKSIAKAPEPEPELEIEVPPPQPIQISKGPDPNAALIDLFAGFNQAPPPTQTNPLNAFSSVPNPFLPPANFFAPEPPKPEPADPFATLYNAQASAPPQPKAVEPTKVIVRKEIRIQKEIPPEVLQRLEELEAKVLQLEAANQKLLAENAALRKENAELRQQLKQNELEKQKVLEDQIALAAQALTAAMFKFDDPNYLGNQAAVAADLLEAAEAFRKSFGDLVGSLKINGQSVQFSTEVADKLSSLLSHAKGWGQHIEDYNIKNELFENCKTTGEKTGDFLGNAKTIVGKLPDPNQQRWINDEHAKVNSLVDAILAAVQKTVQAPSAADQGPDLEDMAEKELLRAANMIEEAARQLEAQNAARMAARSANPSGDLQVEEIIMQAALAITQATQGLVRAATEAQSERVAKGKANPSAFRYHRDPMWVEGLISAARAVAEATRQLVKAANEAVQGRLDEAALIAAAKAVGAATAQLVAATRAKSTDPFSKTQTKLDNAATAVTKATASLVQAARRRGESEEAEMLMRSQNFAEGVKAEIDQQAKILRLEKELETARKHLFSMRKQKYADSRDERAGQQGGFAGAHEPPKETGATSSTLSGAQKAELMAKLAGNVATAVWGNAMPPQAAGPNGNPFTPLGADGQQPAKSPRGNAPQGSNPFLL